MPEQIDAADASNADAFRHDAKLHIHLMTPKLDAAVDLKNMFVDLGETFDTTLCATEVDSHRRPDRRHRPDGFSSELRRLDCIANET